MRFTLCCVILGHCVLIKGALGEVFADEQRLHHYIMEEKKYSKLLRPPGENAKLVGPPRANDNDNDTLTVKLGMRLSQILSLSEKNQIVTTNVWLRHEWYDVRMKWNPYQFGNLTYTHFPQDDLWRPDIILYNNADGDFKVTLQVKATVFYTGLIVWEPPAIYKSYCPINVEFFPFDQQECFMKYSSWTYDGIEIDLQHVWQKEKGVHTANDTFIPMGIDLCDYTANVEWDIINVTAVRKIKYYPCCPEPYPYITFYITIRRKTLFYTINLILPIIAISTLTVLVFYLPSNSGEKITLSVSILLALTVFFLLLSDISPPTSIVIPLIGKYLLFTMIVVTMSIFLTVYTLSVHFRSPATHKMSPWVRRIFTELLPRFLLMKRPSQKQHQIVNVMQAMLEEVQSAKTSLENKINRNTNFIRNQNTQQPRAEGLRKRTGDEDRTQPIYWNETDSSLKGISYIAENLKQNDMDEKEERDWNYVAMVMDRLFLCIFTTACICGTMGIFLNAPSLHDPRTPISRFDFNCSRK